MKLSVFGIIWLVITFSVCFRKNIKSLICLLFSSTVFQAQYVVAFGNNAINAMTITSVIFLLRVTIFEHKNIQINKWESSALVFSCYALLASVFLPIIFNGLSFITISNNDFDFNKLGMTSVNFNIADLSQPLSLILYVIVTIFVFNYRNLFNEIDIVNLFKRIFYIVFIIGCIHLFIKKVGLSLNLFRLLVHNESDILGSDMLDIVGIGGFPKFMSTFYEASYCGAYLAISFFFFIIHNFKFKKITLILCLIAIILNSSSTGYVVWGFGLLLMLIKQIHDRKINITYMLFVLIMLLVVVSISIVNPQIFSPLQELTMNKTMSGSYSLRTQVDNIAMQVFYSTRGWGIGMNQIQTYSLIPALLSQLGVIGFLLYFIFYFETVIFLNGSYLSYRTSNLISLLLVCISQLLSISPLNFCVFWYCIWIIAITYVKNREEIKDKMNGYKAEKNNINYA